MPLSVYLPWASSICRHIAIVTCGHIYGGGFAFSIRTRSLTLTWPRAVPAALVPRAESKAWVCRLHSWGKVTLITVKVKKKSHAWVLLQWFLRLKAQADWRPQVSPSSGSVLTNKGLVEPLLYSYWIPVNTIIRLVVYRNHCDQPSDSFNVYSFPFFLQEEENGWEDHSATSPLESLVHV